MIQHDAFNDDVIEKYLVLLKESVESRFGDVLPFFSAMVV